MSTIAPDVRRRSRTSTGQADRRPGSAGRAGRPDAVPQVSCGQVARSQWAVIVDPDRRGIARTAGSAKSGCTATTLAAATGTAGRTESTFGARLRRGCRRQPRGRRTGHCNGCAPGTSGCTSTASSTSPADAPTSSSTAATTIHRTSRPRRAGLAHGPARLRRGVHRARGGQR